MILCQWPCEQMRVNERVNDLVNERVNNTCMSERVSLDFIQFVVFSLYVKA